MSDIDIEEAAAAPKRERTDEGSVEERSIPDLIKAKQFVESETALVRPPWGIRLARTKPGGTVQ